MYRRKKNGRYVTCLEIMDAFIETSLIKYDKVNVVILYDLFKVLISMNEFSMAFKLFSNIDFRSKLYWIESKYFMSSIHNHILSLTNYSLNSSKFDEFKNYVKECSSNENYVFLKDDTLLKNELNEIKTLIDYADIFNDYKTKVVDNLIKLFCVVDTLDVIETKRSNVVFSNNFSAPFPYFNNTGRNIILNNFDYAYVKNEVEQIFKDSPNIDKRGVKLNLPKKPKLSKYVETVNFKLGGIVLICTGILLFIITCILSGVYRNHADVVRLLLWLVVFPNSIILIGIGIYLQYYVKRVNNYSKNVLIAKKTYERQLLKTYSEDIKNITEDLIIKYNNYKKITDDLESYLTSMSRKYLSEYNALKEECMIQKIDIRNINNLTIMIDVISSNEVNSFNELYKLFKKSSASNSSYSIGEMKKRIKEELIGNNIYPEEYLENQADVEKRYNEYCLKNGRNHL